jgi:hypothetical protein
MLRACGRANSTNCKKPQLEAVSTYYDRLGQWPGYKAHGRNGTP